MLVSSNLIPVCFFFCRGYIQVNLSLPSIHFRRLPRELQEGRLVKVIPVLFTQGINEHATLAERYGNERNLSFCICAVTSSSRVIKNIMWKEKNTFFVMTDFTVIWHGWLLGSLIWNTFSYFMRNCYCKITAFRVSSLRHHEVKNVFFADLEIQVFRKRSMVTITAFWISTLNNSRTSFLMQVCKTFLFSFFFLAI